MQTAQSQGRGDVLHGFVGPGSLLVPGAMRYFPRDDRSLYTPLGAVIGRLHFGMFQKEQHPPMVVLASNAVEQPLMVSVYEPMVPQLMIQLFPLSL